MAEINRERKILEGFGATNIEGYCLINNYGYTFELDGKRYDARYWANCYGVALNVWRVDSLNRRTDNPNFYEPIDPKLEKALENALNEREG